VDVVRMTEALEQLAETYEFKAPADARLYFTDAYLPDAAARMLK
jgi:NitT/TauT family transport system substrate-binding protein